MHKYSLSSLSAVSYQADNDHMWPSGTKSIAIKPFLKKKEKEVPIDFIPEVARDVLVHFLIYGKH